jgi:CheY-like chemotaxis protein/HPt (histidine-containing phosphotransfer) domain-containing protein
VNQNVALHQLQKLGYIADAADNGRAALEALWRANYDVVFMDCQMPELDGYQATAEIRRREDSHRHVPIIAMTANTMAGDRERCLAAGMDDHIGKPIRLEDLDGALSRALAAAESDGHRDASVRSGEPSDDETPLLDASRLADVFDDDQARRRILDLFLDQATDTVEHLAAAVNVGDGAGVQRLAHALKGNSDAVGAFRLAEVSQRLYGAARSERMDAAAEIQADLERSFASTRAALQAQA